MRKLKIKLCSWISFVIFLFSSTLLFAQSIIWVDPSTGRITVKAPREKMEEIEEMLLRFPVQPRQIQIEARIIEISEEITKKFGASLEKLTGLEVPIDTLGEGTRLRYGPRTLTELEQGIGALEFTFYRLTQEERFEVILNMLLTEGKARILSSPRVATLSGEVAGIYVTTEIPYLARITYRVVNEREIPEEHYEYATVGIVLQVLPRIVGEDLVEMSVIPLVGDYEITPEFGVQHPIFKRQISPTNVTIRDGESLVIGGLIAKDKARRIIGLPILSHLPILGRLFRSEIEEVKERSLLITVKPHILKPREIKGRIKRIFHLKYGLAPEVAQRVRELLSSQGSIEVNPKEAPPNSILVRDREDRMWVIQSLLNKIGTFEAQRRQKVYTLTYTSAQDAKTIVEALLSPQGSVKIKEEENSLLVEDGAYQLSLIDTAIFALEQHNSRPQRRFFYLHFIPAKSVVEEVTPLLSPQGSCEVVEERTLVVEDNNWVIQRVREKLEELDTFDRQKETRTYSLRYQVVTELIKSASFQQMIKVEFNPQASVEAKEETNELVITEVSWRQKKVEELIRKFDLYRPVKIIYSAKFWVATSLVSYLLDLLSTRGEIAVDSEKNSLIIEDSPYHIKRIKGKLKELDTFEQVKLQRRIFVTYIPLNEALKVAEEEMSSQGRIIQIEQDKRSFVIEEAPYPLQRIEKRLVQLDTFERQRVIKFYQLKYISPQDASVVIKYFLSPRGKVYAGKEKILVIDDTPYYQAQAEEIIGIIDLPNFPE